jgi:hypothetical protein
LETVELKLVQSLFWVSVLLVNLMIGEAYAKDRAKLIHYGWDNPNLAALSDALNKLSLSPFDGFSVAIPGLDQVFTTATNSAPALPETPAGALANSYVVVHAATDHQFDWANDAHWQVALANMRTLAKLAHDGGFKGLVFDMEPYGKSPWDYQTQPAHDVLSFAKFETLVEARGQDMMNAMQQEFPGLDVWCLYGLSAFTDAIKEPDFDLAYQGYGLWPAFFGGWIKAAAPTTRIIDGNEPSYYYTDAKEFDANKVRIKNDLVRLLPNDVRAAYVAKIQIAHSVFVDSTMNLAGSPRFIGYYFKTDEDRQQLLKQNISAAMQSSDTLVWIYAEQVQWWGKAPRKEIDDAIRAAKSAPVPPASAAIKISAEKWRARISIGGKMLDVKGMPVKPDGFKPAIAKVACSSWGDRGEYGCEFPKGSSFTIEPVLKTHNVKPARMKFLRVEKSNWDVNWLVQ